MSNPAKARGTRWETAVLAYLRERLDARAYKPRQEGHKDVGDIHAADAVWQAKDWKSWEAAMREGLDGAVLQAEHAGRPYGIAVVKRIRRPVGEAYAVMRLADLVTLLQKLEP